MPSDPFFDLGRSLDEVLNDASSQCFRIEQIPDIWALEAETTWLVDELIPEAAVTLISGDSGAGKSTFTLALAGAVTHGTEFLGRTTAKREALILDRENPLAIQKERLTRLMIPRTPHLRIWCGWVDPQPDGPMSPFLLEYARLRPLIVFDSLVAFHPGSEQDSSETRRYMNGFRRLASLGASVIVIHHSGKGESSKQYRGSSDIKASVDTAYHLACAEGSGLESLILERFKQRGGATASTLRIEYREGLFQESGRTNRAILARIVPLHPGSTSTAIVKAGMAAGVRKHRAESLLVEGVQQEWLAVQIGRHNTKRYSFRDERDSSERFSFPDSPL